MMFPTFWQFLGHSVFITNKINTRTKIFFLKIPALSNSRPPGNFQNSNPDPPGNVIELIPGGCRGGCSQLELTETKKSPIFFETFVHARTTKTNMQRINMEDMVDSG